MTQKTAGIPTPWRPSAPTAGPSTNPAEPAASIQPLMRSRSRGRPRTRYGANAAPAVNVGEPTSPNSHAVATNAGYVCASDERDHDRDGEQLGAEQHLARPDTVDEHAGDDRTDDACDGVAGHQDGELGGAHVELVGRHAPDPDEEHGGAAHPRDEAGQHDQGDVAIGEHERQPSPSEDCREESYAV